MEYVRRGFVGLIFVVCINWGLFISFLKFIKVKDRNFKWVLQGLYSLLVLITSLWLASAYLRLCLNEAAYGFTLARIIAHSFMLYLFVTFAYTFIRICLEKLPLLHFYFILGLVFYTGLNGLNIEQFIVNKNIEGYKEVEKLDVHYLNDWSTTGTIELIKLYEKDPEIEDLEELLKREKEHVLDIERNNLAIL